MDNAPERIARSDENPQPVLDEPETDLGQVRALPDAVHADEGDAVRLPLLR